MNTDVAVGLALIFPACACIVWWLAHKAPIVEPERSEWLTWLDAREARNTAIRRYIEVPVLDEQDEVVRTEWVCMDDVDNSDLSGVLR